MTELKKGVVVPKESEVKIHNDGTKEFKLPSGKIAKIKPFKFHHIQAAQRVSGTVSEDFMPALIATTTVIDNKSMVLEDVIEMDGWDGLDLMGKFTGGFAG